MLLILILMQARIRTLEAANVSRARDQSHLWERLHNLGRFVDWLFEWVGGPPLNGGGGS